MEDAEIIFERVLNSVGEDGKFHRRYNIIFNFSLTLFGTMVYLNLILIFITPQHWCYVPGIQNISIERWKQETIPRIKLADGHEVFSSCHMYNRSYEINKDFEKNSIIGCIYRYDYDKTWFEETIVSTLDWVCEKDLYTIYILISMKISEVIGGLCMSYLGDLIGRRPIFFISLIMMTTGRLLLPLLTTSYISILISVIFSSFPSTAVFQSCLVTIMEISPPENRFKIALIHNFAWTLGYSILPLLFWIVKEWDIYIYITTGPLVIFLFLSIFLIESPKWLLNRGRTVDCLQQLRYISKINKTKVSTDAALMLQNCRINIERNYDVQGLFSSWRLTKNFLLMNILWICCMTSYHTMILSVLILEGNPYFTFFLQGSAEIPSYLLGKFLCNSCGRRYIALTGFIIVILGNITFIFIFNDYKTSSYIILTIILKFAITMSYFAINMQSFEIYPTSVRLTANSIAMTIGSVMSISSVYIIYLGKQNNVKWSFIILSIISLIGGVAEIFLPETIHERLPDTLQEAKVFGKDQSYWKLPHSKKDPTILEDIKLIRRQYSEGPGHEAE